MVSQHTYVLVHEYIMNNEPVLAQQCSPGEVGQLAADVVGGEDLVLGTQHLELLARVHLESGHTCRIELQTSLSKGSRRFHNIQITFV